MSDAISVSIRLRPPIKRESGFRNDWRVNGNTISQISKSSVVYAFDQVFDQITSTEDVYGSFAKPVILSVMEGFNGTIFAYGQTASGKTHTMMGDDSCPGIIPQAIDEIFTYIDQHPNREFCLVVSYMEIYNEVITDLLSTNKKNLKIGEDVKGKVWVKDLTATPINSSEQVMDLMAQGEKHRHFGQTLMNERSSRSHTIFQMQIESRDTNEEDDGAVRAALLNLVDLAGSERVSSTGAEGVRFKEGCNINSSLMALGTVISNLSEGESFIPFRNSKLTRILQNSLGGNAKTGIICTITPAAIDETASTLNFASRAKKIKNKPEINEVLDDASIIKRYKRQIKELEEQLNSNTKIEELKNENEMMAQALEEQTRMRRNQEEKLQKLTTFFCTSGGLPKRNFAKRAKRRETWCPGAGLLPLPLLARTPGTKPCDLSVPNILEEQERLVSEEVPPPAAGTAHDISLSSSYNAKEVQCDLQSEEVQQLRKTLQAKIDDLEHMTFLYYEREVNVEDAHNRLRENTEIQQQLRDKNQEHKQRIEELTFELDLASAEIDRLQDNAPSSDDALDIQNIKEENEKLNDTIRKLQDELNTSRSSLEQNKKTCEAKMEEVTNNLRQSTEEQHQLSHKVQRQQQRIEELTCELDLARGELEKNSMEEVTDRLPQSTEIHQLLDKNQEQQQRMEELACELELAKGVLEKNQEQQQLIEELTCELELAKGELEKKQEQQQCIEELTCELELTKGELEKNQEQQQRIKELTCELELAKVELERNKEQQQRIEELTCELELAKGELEKNQEQQQRIEELTCELELAKGELEKQGADTPELEVEEARNRIRESTEIHQQLREKNQEQQQRIEELTCELELAYQEIKNTEERKSVENSEELIALKADLERAKYDNLKLANYRKEENDRLNETIRTLQDEVKSLTTRLDETKQKSEELAACKSELKKAKEEIEKAWTLYDKEKDRLEKINWQMTDELQEKELENDRQYQTIIDLKDDLKSLMTRLEETKQNQNGSEELAACRSELKKAKEEIEKAWALYDKEKDRLEKLNWQMTDELQEKELENDRQYQTIVDLKDELKSLKASPKEIKQNQNGLSEELAACKSELEKAKEEIEKAWALYDKEKDRLEKINWQMTDELQEKELENDRQYQKIVDLKDELKSLTASLEERKQNQNGSEELATCRSELEKAKGEIEKAWTLYDKEKDRLEKLNGQLIDELKSLTSVLDEMKKESENDAQCQKILDLKGKQEDLSIQLANRNMQIMELQCTAYKQEDTIALLNREVEYQRKRAENMANDANKLREERERKKDAAAADGGGVVSSVAVFTLKAKVIELEKMVEKLKKENEHLERDRDHQALLKTDRGHQIRRLEGEIYQLQGKLRKYRGERPVLETSNRLQDVAQESDLSTIKSKSAQELEAENRRAHSSWLSPSKTKDLMEKESPLEQLQDQCKQQ